ncbi:electron transport complex protein RnfG [Alkalibaculum bacchi]|uniref:Ion-translocating oxidoreductase complex subunit G n=1 Tax=Alkalibaculum bacchi TaxID=645887 RepID=A0A366IFB8_9FIRM|nr:RnfABCDGE type electron transport complex subunit G [Alkalibaculum bacchi]RBP70073.1 electron transport complex protein RnfG [Alkalibaculum bacchi]
MKEIINLALKLFVITAVAALALAFTNSITGERIAEQIEMENKLAREEVISPSDYFEQVEQQTIIDHEKKLGFNNLEIISEVYKDIVGDEIIGYTFKVLPKGYGGEMNILVGISIEGEITGLKVVGHSETPGLGAKATEKSFQDQFAGMSTSTPLTVIKSGTAGDSEVQAITGSTITTQAVTDGVNAALEVFNEMNK